MSEGTAMKRVRTKEPVREQGVFRWEMPEDTLSANHPARLLWQVLGTLDLSGFLRDAKAVDGRQGRDALSVRMLLTLWLYAISIGVGSAREIARRIQSDTAFQWIVGDQSAGHAKLSEFRIGHRDVVDKLFTDVLGTLLHRQLMSLELVAQDGTRVRASASAPSFRRAASLEECREQAALHLKAVLAEADDPEATEAEKLARLAAAVDYQRRVDEAIATVKELQSQGKKEPRASTTDAEARVMKMADGGFRPAYNVQLATAGSPMGGPRTIVGVRVTNVGSDLSSVSPMLDDIERRTGRLPAVLMADANHGDHASIRDAEARGVTALIAVPKSRGGATAGEHAENDPPIAAWRARMQTDEAKQTYRARASLCELPNAHFKSRLGLGHLLVRGLSKVTCVVLLTALASNLLAHANVLLTA
jgi:transposase